MMLRPRSSTLEAIDSWRTALTCSLRFVNSTTCRAAWARMFVASVRVFASNWFHPRNKTHSSRLVMLKKMKINN